MGFYITIWSEQHPHSKRFFPQSCLIYPAHPLNCSAEHGVLNEDNPPLKHDYTQLWPDMGDISHAACHKEPPPMPSSDLCRASTHTLAVATARLTARTKSCRWGAEGCWRPASRTAPGPRRWAAGAYWTPPQSSFWCTRFPWLSGST